MAGTYDWEFGDGSAHSNLQSATHNYASPWTYHWVMRMSGLPCTKEGGIVISNDCTAPVITADPASQTTSIKVKIPKAAKGTVQVYVVVSGKESNRVDFTIK